MEHVHDYVWNFPISETSLRRLRFSKSWRRLLRQHQNFVTMVTKEDTMTTPWIISTVPSCFNHFRPLVDLKKRYHVVDLDDYLQHEEEYDEKIRAILVITKGTSIFTEERLRKMTNLKLFQTWSSGTDHLDITLLRKYKIRIGNTPGVIKAACANLAMTLLLAAARRLPENIADVKSVKTNSEYNWQGVVDLMGKSVSGANLGIVGMGTIGFAVAKRAKAFGMNILYHNRTQRSVEDETEVQATFCSTIEALLPQADFLLLVAPLTTSTRHIMNNETFKLMKSDSILINIARGGLVNHDHLVEALNNGTIASAALDVTDPEPLPNDHALLTMPNVIITPHIATCTAETLEAMLQIAIDNIHAAIDGKELVAEIL